jgi:hypothetical protein
MAGAAQHPEHERTERTTDLGRFELLAGGAWVYACARLLLPGRSAGRLEVPRARAEVGG